MARLRRAMFRTTTLIVLIALTSIPGVATAQDAGEDPCDTVFDHDFAQMLLDTNDTGDFIDDYDPDGNGIACDHAGPPQTDGQAVLRSNSQSQEASGNEFTDQERAYLDALVEDMDEFATISDEIAKLFSDAGNDVTLIFNEEWRIDLAVQLAQWQQIAEEAQALNPSPRQLQIHEVWLDITSLVLLAIDDYTYAIDNVDPDILTRGSTRINYATLLIEDLSGATESFMDNPNGTYQPQYALNPVADCAAFRDYEMAQQYYAAWPEEQPTIDPDFDGLACEVFFGVE